ncbi:hypothetical protein SUDANB180_07801 (plasmid) [Streptomyces sp. enrichment culture]
MYPWVAAGLEAAPSRRPPGRLKAAGQRHLAAGQSRRPRPRQNRIGNAAARRPPPPRQLRHFTAWLR